MRDIKPYTTKETDLSVGGMSDRLSTNTESIV